MTIMQKSHSLQITNSPNQDDEGRERNGWWSLGLGARAELIMMIWKKMDLKMVIGWPSFYEDNALIVQDGLGYDWSYVAQDEPTEFALMAYTSYSSRSDTELGLQSVEAQLIVHQKNEVVCEEKITVLEFEVKDKSNAITRLKNQLDETLKEKDDLKAKLEQFKRSSKNLNKLINRLDDSVYRPTANKTSASVSQVETSISQTSNTSVEMPRVESVRPSGVIIEDWVSDDEDIFQSNDLQATDKPSLKRNGFTNIWEKLLVIGKLWENKFVLSAVLTRFGRVPVSAAKQSSFRAVASTEVTSPIKALFHKSHSTNTSISNEIVNTVRVNGVNTTGQTAVSAVKGNRVTTDKASAVPGTMTGNKDFLTDYQDIDGGFVAFGGGTKGATDKNKYSLRVPKQSNMYSFDLRNVVPSGDLTCLFINATIDDSNYGNRSIVTKPHNKTPYELIIGRPPSISFMRPFGCPVTILNTLDPLGKFDGKAEEGFLVGYSVNSKAFRVFNSQTRKVEENLHVNFLENKPNVAG
ncbi:putative ribonuclease H-like domain-containing protein [Tanacetum coccineum]